MHRPIRTASLIAAAGLCALSGAVAAQDSVSRNADGGNGLPGDALSPWGIGPAQRANYIVDLAPFTTSRGTSFGIAPVMKSGATRATTFTAINGVSTLSPTVMTAAAAPAANYQLWTAPAAGVNPAANDLNLVTSVNPPATLSVLGLAVFDFDLTPISGGSVFTNQITAGQIAFDPAAPDRLYVTRVIAAVNNPSGQGDRSQLGLGGVDATGKVIFRADGFNATGPSELVINGDRYLRIDTTRRGYLPNLIDRNGGSDTAATTVLLSSTTDTLPPPTVGIAPDRSPLLATNLKGQFRYESSPGVFGLATSHRGGTLDQRGGVSASPAVLFPNTVGTGAVIARTAAGRNDTISVFGMNAVGAPVTSRSFVVPATLTDPCDAFPWPVAGGEFRHYDSQILFRGGSAQVAVGRDAAGRGLAAATVSHGSGSGSDNPYNAIAVVRFDPANAGTPAQWATVAWVNAATSTGKAITGDYGADGVPNTSDAGEGDGVIDATDAPIGRLAAASEGALALPGPSLSAPAIDSFGNIYFIAAVALRDLDNGQIVNRYTTALVRGLCDPTSVCYTLELVLAPGDIVAGRNSATNYVIDSLQLGDSDSVSTASLWPSSIAQQPWNNEPVAADAADPRHLGGLALSARIVYDRNADGAFADPTRAGNSASPDEAYNAVLYIAYAGSADTYCPADYDGSGGIDGDDIAAFFTDWQQGEADVDRSGGTDGDDITFFFAVWQAGGC